MNRRVFFFCVFFFSFSCRNDRDFVQEGTTPSLTPEEFQEFECPPDWFLIPSVTADIGAPSDIYNQTDEDGYKISRVPLFTASIEAVCISPFPYPGEEASVWPEGLNLSQAASLDAQLAPFGVRLATGSEYLVAVATSSNDRWPQGAQSWEAADCDPDPNNPSVMGSYSTCSSAWGPGALLTFAFWAKADTALKEILDWITVEEYVVMGGMPTDWDAYYGDDHWGVHQHGEEEPYFDDKPGFLVSTPWEVTPEQWENFQEFRNTRRVARTRTQQPVKNHRRPVVE